MQLESLVNQNYDKLNENDKAIVAKILKEQRRFQSFSCEQIAMECHISRATLLRMCRKIGLPSFSDLKYALKEKQRDMIQKEGDFHEICTQYQLLLEELEKTDFHSLCERIDQAETIYIYGTGNEQKNLAQELKRIFLSVHKCVIDLFDRGEVELLKNTFEEDDLFIIISLSGETKEGIEIIKEIRNHIHTCSFTRLQNNTISTLCEESLYVSTQKLSMIHMPSYEVVGAFYVLLDLLFMNYIEYRRRIV